MRSILARIFRVLFKLIFFKKRHFGITVKIFKPYKLFKDVRKTIDYRGFSLELKLDDWIQENIYFLGDYERAELNTLKQFLTADSVFLDIGANFGLYTLNAAKIISHPGKIISFEPFSKNFEALQKNVKTNNLSQVQLINSAVSNVDSTIQLYLDENENNLGSVSASPIENALIESVKTICIDGFLENTSLNKIDLVKIDVEGHEYNVLQGMKKTLKTFQPALLIEILDESTVKNEITNFLTGLGYKQFYIDDEGEISESCSNNRRFNFLFKIP